MPGARCTRGLVCQKCALWRTRAYRAAETLRHPLRNGFTAYIALSPVERACCHRHLRKHPTGLAPASRRQDHTTSPYALAFRPARSLAPDAKASITSRAPRVVTIMIRPSCGRETGGVIIRIYGNVKRYIFDFGA